MLKGFTENGEMKNVRTDEKGNLKVALDEETMKAFNKGETTISSSIQNVGLTAITVEINKRVTSIMVANYSETADISMSIGEKSLNVGANLALELPINAQVENISITATEENVKMQLVVKGEV